MVAFSLEASCSPWRCSAARVVRKPVKTSHYIAASGVLFTSLALSTPAFAQKYNSFGDLNGADDCQYETAANLILHEFPKSTITTSEVESAYTTFGGAFQGQSVTTDDGATWTLQGLWAGQNYLLAHGFDGHRARAIIPVVSRYAMVHAANSGGLEVTVMGPTMNHMFAITRATATEVTEVDAGYVYHYTWANFIWRYTHAVSPQGTIVSNGVVMAFYAVKWA